MILSATTHPMDQILPYIPKEKKKKKKRRAKRVTKPDYLPVLNELGEVTGIVPNEKKIKAKTQNTNSVIGLRVTPVIAKRFNYILEQISKGKSRQDILELCVKNYELTINSAQNYYVSALKWLKNANKKDREFMREKHEVMLMELYNNALIIGNTAEAHKILITLNKMFGLNEPEKKESTQTFEFKFNTATTPIQLNIKADEDIDYQDVNDNEDGEEE